MLHCSYNPHPTTVSSGGWGRKVCSCTKRTSGSNIKPQKKRHIRPFLFYSIANTKVERIVYGEPHIFKIYFLERIDRQTYCVLQCVWRERKKGVYIPLFPGKKGEESSTKTNSTGDRPSLTLSAIASLISVIYLKSCCSGNNTLGTQREDIVWIHVSSCNNLVLSDFVLFFCREHFVSCLSICENSVTSLC